MYLKWASTSLLLALLSIPSSVSAFTIGKSLLGQQQYITNENGLTSSSSSLSPLYAKGGTKKKPKKKKATTSSTGGFGKVVERPTSNKKKSNDDVDDDYAAFPRLDDNVQQTLIPSDDALSSVSQDLSQEMYDRLAQIYAFENFNYPEGWFDDDGNDKEEEEEESSNANSDEGTMMSFDDLLTSGSNGSASISPSSDFSDLLKETTSASSTSAGKSEFADLIASATGGTSTSSTNSENTSQQQQNTLESISNLKPFTKFRVLHVDPMVLAIDDFFTHEECDAYVNLCKAPKKRTSNNDMPMMSRSKTVGKDSLAKAQRTSTTWFHHFKSVPELVAKATRLVGLDTIDRWEEPQTVRYQQSEKFTWHLDALAPSDSLNDTGGQRVATLLVYLTDIGENNGGSTAFRDLGRGGNDSEGDVNDNENGDGGKYLKVKPVKGSALLFFPAAGGIPNTPFDIRTLHAGEALSADATEEKWIAQMWLRENSNYKPSAPPGNSHADATDAVNAFCNSADSE